MTEPKEWRKHWTGDREYCVSCGRTPKQGHLRACVFSKLARAERENERLMSAWVSDVLNWANGAMGIEQAQQHIDAALQKDQEHG